MTNREAIENIKLLCGFKNDLQKKQRNQYTAKKYREEVEALSMAIAALEKQEPVRPDYHTCGAGEYYTCPKCGYRGVNDYYGNYCNKCGQLLSWEEAGKWTEVANDRKRNS